MDTKHFKQRLVTKEQELQQEISNLESTARDSAQPEVRDATDDASSSQATSEALQEESMLSEMLAQVREALKRIDQGSYGKCDACGGEIEPARLEAVPWAKYCLADQEKLDKFKRVPIGGSSL